MIASTLGAPIDRGMNVRQIEPELLDELPPTAPEAVESRRDLQRLNWWMRSSSAMAKALLKAHGETAPSRIIELGAGDGTFLYNLAQKLRCHWKHTQVVLVDRQDTVAPDMRRRFAALGWPAETVVADVFKWLPQNPERPDGIIVANLFLHHFTNERLIAMVAAAAPRCRVFAAHEPRRSGLPLAAARALWLIGCNHVTRHDAAVSVRAGFARDELSALWPTRENWALLEKAVRPFSHLFVARRELAT
jgi:hypothetical protein